MQISVKSRGLTAEALKTESTYIHVSEHFVTYINALHKIHPLNS